LADFVRVTSTWQTTLDGDVVAPVRPEVDADAPASEADDDSRTDLSEYLSEPGCGEDMHEESGESEVDAAALEVTGRLGGIDGRAPGPRTMVTMLTMVPGGTPFQR
jgi:hypothetical protein